MNKFFVGIGLIIGVLIVSGCGGGDDATTPTANGSPTIFDITYAPSPNETITLGEAGTRIPVLRRDGTLRIDVQITDDTGVDNEQSPPTLSLYESENSPFFFVGPLTLQKVAGQTARWSYDLQYRVTPVGALTGIKIVVITATDLQGNRTSTPVGLIYFNNRN